METKLYWSTVDNEFCYTDAIHTYCCCAEAAFYCEFADGYEGYRNVSDLIEVKRGK